MNTPFRYDFVGSFLRPQKLKDARKNFEEGTISQEKLTAVEDECILEKNNGVLLIRELPDTVKLKETEAEAYSAILDIVIKLQKELPMSYVFYGQDSLVEDNTRYDEIGVFLPNSHFLKNLERHVSKAEAIIYADN